MLILMIIVLLFCDARTDYIKKLSTKGIGIASVKADNVNLCTGFNISEDDEEAYITNYEVNQAKEDGVDYIALYACRNVSHHSAKSWQCNTEVSDVCGEGNVPTAIFSWTLSNRDQNTTAWKPSSGFRMAQFQYLILQAHYTMSHLILNTQDGNDTELYLELTRNPVKHAIGSYLITAETTYRDIVSMETCCEVSSLIYPFSRILPYKLLINEEIDIKLSYKSHRKMSKVPTVDYIESGDEIALSCTWKSNNRTASSLLDQYSWNKHVGQMCSVYLMFYYYIDDDRQLKETSLGLCTNRKCSKMNEDEVVISHHKGSKAIIQWNPQGKLRQEEMGGEQTMSIMNQYEEPSINGTSNRNPLDQIFSSFPTTMVILSIPIISVLIIVVDLLLSNWRHPGLEAKLKMNLLKDPNDQDVDDGYVKLLATDANNMDEESITL